MPPAYSTLQEQVAQQQLETCLIWQNGQLTFEFAQQKPLLNQIRPINSCTKSVVSLLCCIAMDKGLFPQPEELAKHYFPVLEHIVPRLYKQPTIEHLLTLSVGFKWQEFGGIQSFPRMKRSHNWLEYLFTQPIVSEPGTSMCYNSGISQMLTTLLTQTTGMPVASFAEEHLFKQLKIEEYKWLQDKQGIYTGGYGLYLTPLAMLKIGILCVQHGTYENKQVVSAKRLAESTGAILPAMPPAKAGYYGWHWWIDSIDVNDQTIPFYYARGYGGQFIFIVPTLALVVVTTKDQAIKGELPIEWFKNQLLPSFA